VIAPGGATGRLGRYERRQALPEPPTDGERLLYVKRHLVLLGVFVLLGFAGISYGIVRLTMSVSWAGIFLAWWCFAMLSFALSFFANYSGRDFDVTAHDEFVRSFSFDRYPSIDVWLPNCGEPIELLRNTWIHVSRLAWPGVVNVYCLDDRGLPEVRAMAAEFGFTYLSRPDKGWMKKSGNLRFAYEHSNGELIVLFDADFCPRPDILFELVPYLLENERLAIVQTAQFFRVLPEQRWIERGAAQVQEFFYRACQWSRQQHDAAICCGTNAVYRRTALDDNGGMTLIPQGEDMRTGFDLHQLGWRLLYLPLNLAAGLCPADLSSFFKQQYRWCTGSLRLLSDEQFWRAPLSRSARLSYLAGFNYYVQTALSAFMIPALMLSLLLADVSGFRLSHYAVLIPALAVLVLVYPLWHRARYGPAAWSVRIICQWSYVFAILDFLHEAVIPWDATGSGSATVASSRRFKQFKWSSFCWNATSSLAWVTLAVVRAVQGDWVNFVVVSVMGIFYLFNSFRLVESFFQPELVA
jgi:cellulose synthase (UDP-forming)